MKKVRTRFRKSGLNDDEYDLQCCYSCTFCKKPNSDGRGICALDNEKKYIYSKNYCTKYDNADLIVCEECDKWFRSLIHHVHTHGLTTYEYKEKYGYNRTTGLISRATSDTLSKYALEEDRLGDSKGTHPDGCRGLTWHLRGEGIVNNIKALQKKGGHMFMMNMVNKHIELTTGLKSK